MQRSIYAITLTTSLLLACPGPKESETSATTGTEDETIGHSSAPQSSSATAGVTTGVTTAPNPTTGPGPTTDPPDPSTTSSSTTVFPGETTTTTGTTGEGCVPDPPEPKMCNKLKGGNAADPEVFGASTGCEGAFICPVDAGAPNECDIFTQDCPEGQKCNAWSSDGDSSWDATKCVPVDPNPDPIGAPCTVEGSGVSGIDSCAKGAMCWGVDDQTLTGTCIELCTCSPDNPICSVTPGSSCTIANDGVLALCLPSCDPLDGKTCPGGQVCVGNPQDPASFICVVDASGDAGQLGDPCEFLNACDPTLLCANPELLPGCDQAAPGCCVPFCDISAVDCPPGVECLPWFEPGQAPKCFENIGVCGLKL